MLAACALGSAASAGATESSQWRWQGVERVIAFGDVHGDYDALYRLLTFAEVIDADGHWSAGSTHLVSVGDLLDRGPDSRQVMDLLIRLEGEAQTAGGRVHVLIGNHEQMNLTGDLRYVADEEFAAFAGADDDALRDAAARQAREAGLNPAQVLERPAGFFAHRAAFAPDGHYGRWLLSLGVIAVINDTAFVHGGLVPRPAIAAAWVPALQATLREATRLRSAPELQRPDLLDRDVVNLGLPDGLASLPANARKLSKPLQRIAEAMLFSGTGPLWYRGNAACHPALEGPSLQAALDQLEVKQVAVGHTVQRDHRIRQRLDGRVIMLDTGMLNRYYGGQPRALLLEGDQTPRILSPDGMQDTLVSDAPAVLARRTPAELARLLQEGTLGTSDDQGRATLVLDDASVEVDVLTWSARERRRALAAYHVDQQLGLDFVPMLAERGEGRDAVLLRIAQGKWLSESARKKAKRNVPNWCSQGHVFTLVRLFDSLIGHSRRPEELSYAVPGLSIRLTGHDDAFTNTDKKAAAPDLPAATAIALLERLDETFQQQALGELLSRAQLRALEARRASLLKQYRAL